MDFSSWQDAGDGDKYARDRDAFDALAAGERVCAPARRRRSSGPARVYFAFAVLCLGLYLATQPLPANVVAAIDALSAVFTRTSVASVEKPAATTPPPLPASAPAPTEPIREAAVAERPSLAGDAAPPPATAAAPAERAAPPPAEETAADEPSTAKAEDQKETAERPAPLTPPKVDPADRNQAKALAAGLNPSLSSALLAGLSAADFRNAGKAVRVALASSSDAEVVLMPKTRKAGLAQFEVHFVRSAATDCRRYIVKIAKDGWATTAAPMEKCGFKPERSQG